MQILNSFNHETHKQTQQSCILFNKITIQYEFFHSILRLYLQQALFIKWKYNLWLKNIKLTT